MFPLEVTWELVRLPFPEEGAWPPPLHTHFIHGCKSPPLKIPLHCPLPMSPGSLVNGPLLTAFSHLFNFFSKVHLSQQKKICKAIFLYMQHVSSWTWGAQNIFPAYLTKVLCCLERARLSYFLSSVHFRCTVVSDSLWPHGLQQARPPCLSPTPGVYPNSCPLSQWRHPTVSSSVIPFSCLQYSAALGSFQMGQFFASGGQSIGVSASASVLPMNIQDWSLGWTSWISLQSKGLSRVLSNTIVSKHQFFGTQLSL